MKQKVVNASIHKTLKENGEFGSELELHLAHAETIASRHSQYGDKEIPNPDITDLKFNLGTFGQAPAPEQPKKKKRFAKLRKWWKRIRGNKKPPKVYGKYRHANDIEFEPAPDFNEVHRSTGIQEKAHDRTQGVKEGWHRDIHMNSPKSPTSLGGLQAFDDIPLSHEKGHTGMRNPTHAQSPISTSTPEHNSWSGKSGEKVRSSKSFTCHKDLQAFDDIPLRHEKAHSRHQSFHASTSYPEHNSMNGTFNENVRSSKSFNSRQNDPWSPEPVKPRNDPWNDFENQKTPSPFGMTTGAHDKPEIKIEIHVNPTEPVQPAYSPNNPFVDHSTLNYQESPVRVKVAGHNTARNTFTYNYDQWPTVTETPSGSSDQCPPNDNSAAIQWPPSLNSAHDPYTFHAANFTSGLIEALSKVYSDGKDIRPRPPQLYRNLQGYERFESSL
ncbi:unnamed protein product [Owenia fusiformis]|uniref:Uncharacterized protein n=1 Tax=Owenia fusiformis TaxID=6347 RepID=A0A8J1XXE3_OWEFU|nr:unnamed protein product [Owenia fusiformis]